MSRSVQAFAVGLQAQVHQLFAVLDYNTKLVNIEFGVGFGLTSTSDRLTVKLRISRDFN